MVYTPQNTRTLATLSGRVERENRVRLEQIYEAGKKIGSVPRLSQVLEQVIRMTQHTLGCSAASILLFRDNNHELYFEAATGPVSKTLRQVKLSTQYGIAGQVVRTGKPLIVNDVVRSEKFHKMIDDTTGFNTRSLLCAPLMVNHKIMGVIEVLNKRDGSNFEDADLEAAVSVANTAALAIENTRLHQTVLDAYKDTVISLALAVDEKDPYTRGHSRRVMEYSMLAGSFLSLSPEETEVLEFASVLHDIGKISIDTLVLSKPGTLSPAEWQIMHEHPGKGARILQEIPFLERAAEVVLAHHERYDGEGYPNRLQGEDIPMGARLIAVADAFDSMTTDRSYRTALSVDYAVRELNRGSGNQFCPICIKAFVSGLRLRTNN
ncbi:MAG: GAF domain-containing protein [Dehalococcoidales bacterium]|nr:GAF domain-containing protein [Dehalococcoidales bacterium]